MTNVSKEQQGLTVKKKPKMSLRRRQEERVAIACTFPSFIGLACLTYGPLLAVFIISFFDWKGITAPTWNGINNYIRLFTKDPYFF